MATHYPGPRYINTDPSAAHRPVTTTLNVASPYHRYNLVRNPFGELTRQDRSWLAVVAELDDYLAVLQSGARPALQFIGRCGRGKSTHLLAIAARSSAATYVYFPESGRRPRLPAATAAAGSEILIVDEAQRMGWFRRHQMLRSRRPLVLGTHRDLSRPLQRHGYAVTTVDLNMQKTAGEISAICNRRIAAAALDLAKPLPTVDLQLAAQLLQRYGSDIRAAEAELYDSFQASVQEGLAWPH